MDLPDETEDWYHTPEGVAKVMVTEKQLLSNYLAASVAFTRSYLDQIKEEQLPDVIDKNRIPSATRQVCLASAIDDAVMYFGQAAYTRRLVIGK